MMLLNDIDVLSMIMVPWLSTLITGLTPLRPVIVLTIFLVWGQVNCSANDPVYMMHDCPKRGNFDSSGTTFEANRNDTLFTELPAKALERRFYNFSKGVGVDQVYALFYCRGDLNTQICQNCVKTAAAKIAAECEFEGIAWYDQCTLRYANHSIFSIVEEFPSYIHRNKTGIMNNVVLDPHQDLFDSTMKSLVEQAAYKVSSQGYAKRSVTLSSSQSLDCLVQCTPDIIGAGCARCLQAALSQRDTWADTKVFLPSCFIMYDLFGSQTSLPETPSATRMPVGAIAGIVVGGIVFVAVLIGVYIFYFWKPRNGSDVPAGISARDGAVTYEYEDLANATYFFHERNLLGKGGFGKVYKGVLTNEGEVAIKKLNPESFQGEVEFESEIETLGRIHHKHLVSLLGCCIQGSHRLLVYEYMANNSLFFHLHERRGIALDWRYRKRIALGAAYGLSYLHHSCEPRIIHRDIKSSNILLDSKFDAKISDFGLARCIPDDVTHVTTQIRGTFGYIAPEINLGRKGEVSEKTDVYSFGVVLLELISGQKPEYANWAKEFLEQVTANGDYDYTKLVDPRMTECDNSEIRQVVDCAVTCVETMTGKRPTMFKIVQVLEDITPPNEERTPLSQYTSSPHAPVDSQGSTSAKSTR